MRYESGHTKTKLFLYTAVVVIVAVFVLFHLSDYTKLASQNTIDNSAAVINAQIQDATPKYFYFSKNAEKKLQVAADAYVVGDLDTGEVILAKNQVNKFPIASVSKLMTATISKETQDQDGIVTISKKALQTEGQNGNFHLNEKLKVGTLLYPLLLESSNDAAEAIAEHSGFDTFINAMNDKAKELGMASTTFQDSSGLSSHNISTALDLFKLTKYIKEKNPGLFDITKNQSYKASGHTWLSNNQFLKQDEYLGGKSGYTDAARQTVVSTFSLPLGATGEKNIAITLLHTPDRYKDVESIVNFLKSNIYYGLESDADANWVKERVDLVTNEPPSEVTLGFAGDIMLDRGVKSSVNKNFNGDYSKLFEKLSILNTYDIMFANLEGPVSDKGTDLHNLYSFRMDPSVVPALVAGHIDIVSVANNHVGDWGRVAYGDTLARLKENELLYAGGGNNKAEAITPTIIEKNGMKIGYLAFSDKGPNDMAATDDSAGLLLTSDPNFDNIIRNAASQVDDLVVSFHFGEEYQTKHNQRQADLAHRAVDDGAKLVIGSHPHVIQDTEVYKNSLIAYSLGNFIFDQRFSTDTMQGMLLGVTLHKDGQMSMTKNIVKLNQLFQPDQVIKGKEEKIKF